MGVGSAIAKVAVGAASIGSEMINNARNVAYQNLANERQYQFAHNAYSIAAADRMRAGLSPLDTQAATVPQVTAPQTNSVSSRIDESYNRFLQSKQVDAMANQSNAQAAASRADAYLKTIDVMDKVNTTNERLEAMKTEYQNTIDKGSNEAKILENQIKIQEKELQKMQEVVNQIKLSNVRDTWDYEWYQSMNMPIGGVNLGLSPAGNAAAWNGKVSKDIKDAQKSTPPERKDYPLTDAQIKRRKELQSMYNAYVDDYNRRKKELDRLVYERKLSRTDAKKQLGTLVSFDKWLRGYAE